MKIYTRRGDDGTTALRAGSRVRKDSPQIEALGALDEAQAALGAARAELVGTELDDVLTGIERDLWVLMAEVATDPVHLRRLEPGVTAVTKEMVDQLEPLIDSFSARIGEITVFTVPGEDRASAALDVARTVIRRAERRLAGAELATESHAPSYVNRLSDLCWTLARVTEDQHRLTKNDGGGQ